MPPASTQHGVVDGEDGFENRDQRRTRHRIAGLQGDRALDLRVHDEVGAQRVAEDRLDHLAQIGIDEVERDLALRRAQNAAARRRRTRARGEGVGATVDAADRRRRFRRLGILRRRRRLLDTWSGRWRQVGRRSRQPQAAGPSCCQKRDADSRPKSTGPATRKQLRRAITPCQADCFPPIDHYMTIAAIFDSRFLALPRPGFAAGGCSSPPYSTRAKRPCQPEVAAGLAARVAQAEAT